MDAMMTAKGSVWDPPAQVVEDCTREIDEVIRSDQCLLYRMLLSHFPPMSRVLRKPGGAFIYITFGQPHFRRRFLTRDGWDLEVREFGDMFHYYCYIMRPKATA